MIRRLAIESKEYGALGRKKSVSIQKWKTMLKMEYPKKTGLVGADCIENNEYNQHEKPADV